MNARRPLHPLEIEMPATSYNVWLSPNQYEFVRMAINNHAGGCADWVSQALARLLRESTEEIESLIGGNGNASRAGKDIMPFRIKGSDLLKFKSLAVEHKSSIQRVLATCFFMHALAPVGLLFPTEADVAADDTFDSILNAGA